MLSSEKHVLRAALIILCLISTLTLIFVNYTTTSIVKPTYTSLKATESHLEKDEKRVGVTGRRQQINDRNLGNGQFISIKRSKRKKRKQKKISQKTSYTKVLVWNKHLSKYKKQRCGTCEFSFNKSEADDPAIKAIVYYFNTFELQDITKRSRRDKFKIWWCRESPSSVRYLHGMKLHEYDNLFNATMTYRRDSDLYIPYYYPASIYQSLNKAGDENVEKTIDNLFVRKKYLAVWFVSNCKSTYGATLRMVLVNSLIKAGLKLERGGKCFTETKDARRETIRDYKFYLAFENSWHCKDYITEKMFVNSYMYDAVPVVWGARKSDYNAIAPPDSFIYAEDYTASELVQYLNYLDKNSTAYKSYFRWRKMKVEEMPLHNKSTPYLCKICELLNKMNISNLLPHNSSKISKSISLPNYSIQSSVVSSLRDWFYGNESRECLPTY